MVSSLYNNSLFLLSLGLVPFPLLWLTLGPHIHWLTAPNLTTLGDVSSTQWYYFFMSWSLTLTHNMYKAYDLAQGFQRRTKTKPIKPEKGKKNKQNTHTSDYRRYSVRSSANKRDVLFEIHILSFHSSLLWVTLHSCINDSDGLNIASSTLSNICYNIKKCFQLMKGTYAVTTP